jgi:hypothetical protein
MDENTPASTRFHRDLQGCHCSCRPRNRRRFISYTIDRPLRPLRPLSINTGLLHDVDLPMAPATSIFRMIRKRRFTFRSI